MPEWAQLIAGPVGALVGAVVVLGIFWRAFVQEDISPGALTKRVQGQLDQTIASLATAVKTNESQQDLIERQTVEIGRLSAENTELRRLQEAGKRGG